MSNTKSLLIVEGEKAEYKFFQCLGKQFGIELIVFPIKDNLYVLYKKLKEDDFNVNILNVLIEMFPDKKEMLSDSFAFTYLIFDLDPHHTENQDQREYIEIVNDNLEHALEMTEFFRDETDPTVGKIYINYPMFESYRYCNSVFDENYKDAFINIIDVGDFKKLAGKKKLASKHLDKYVADDYISLSKMNIFKLNYIYHGKWSSLQYSQYRTLSEASFILKKQKEQIDSFGKIAVLNTSLFLLVDYFGNKDGAYEKFCII